MSQYEDQMDDHEVICPYCETKWQPEDEDASEDIRTVECDRCGKKYRLFQSFCITNNTEPDFNTDLERSPG